MAFQIGTDEAGYGPNLGPLTVAASLWNVPTPETDLYNVLAEVLSRTPEPGKLMIADSKVVYSSSGSISRLETSVLALLYAITGSVPGSWRELIQLVCEPSAQTISNECWTFSEKLTLPMAADMDVVRRLGDQFARACETHRVRLLRLSCRAVFAPEFNAGIDSFGNKASLLSSVTLMLARSLTDSIVAPGAINLVCDKHGGRSRYSALLSEYLTNEFIWVDQESTKISAYRWTDGDNQVKASFVAGGESFLPTALSSMLAKYLREIFMELWNSFWQLKIPDLKATKGYPVDAKRFKKDIAKMQKSLGIADDAIWRKR